MTESALLGCDFSSSPTRRKPIMLAWGKLRAGRVQLERLQRIETLEDFTATARQGQWIGGFDLPFGLPRELVQTLGWPTDWQASMAHYSGLSRADIRAQFAAFCQARPAGSKFAHRATDGPAHSSPSMKWVNPPVAFMLHAGVPRLLEAGVYFPGLQEAPAHAPQRVALEAYPALVARRVLGARSYKSDDRAKQTPERLIARKDLLQGLELGQAGIAARLVLADALRDALVQDATGDSLDATVCLVLAAWAAQQHAQGAPLYGLPTAMDPLEGWILGA